MEMEAAENRLMPMRVADCVHEAIVVGEVDPRLMVRLWRGARGQLWQGVGVVVALQFFGNLIRTDAAVVLRTERSVEDKLVVAVECTHETLRAGRGAPIACLIDWHAPVAFERMVAKFHRRIERRVCPIPGRALGRGIGDQRSAAAVRAEM